MNPLKTIWDACVDPQDNVQDILELLKQGANANEISNVYKTAPLHLACRKGNFKVVKKLLEHGASVDVLDNKAQCGNFRIFLSFKFYVKSILENREVSFWQF